MDVLLGKTLEELQAVALSVGLQKFAGKQLAEWLYVRRVTSFDEMTNISLKGREALKAAFTIGRHDPVREAVSVDGTRKYLFAIGDQFIESVYIPEDDRATLCVSTQMGCKMGCRFCMTGTLGFHGQLPAAEILNQIFYFDDLSNIVYMGEGEPMDNLDNVLRSLEIMTAPYGCAWSPKRITVRSETIPGRERMSLGRLDAQPLCGRASRYHAGREDAVYHRSGTTDQTVRLESPAPREFRIYLLGRVE